MRPAGAELIRFVDRRPPAGDFRAEALAGLERQPKELPPKFFYDKRGSELFERICDLPEYYLTRSETGILADRAAEIASLCGERCLLIEYGSGASRKVRILLDALAPGCSYLAIDISREHLLESAELLATEYPTVEVWAVCADYTQPFELPEEALAQADRRVVFFPGSTIGNFGPAEACRFLRLTARELGPGGGLVVGADLPKDPATLEAAYDDAAGVTAEFNLNLLRRMNRELNADFDLDSFAHRALYNESEGRVEMHLVSRRRQIVTVAGREISFEEGESIHTESSYKFGVAEFQRMAAECGFTSERVWTDDARRFSVHFMRTAA